MIIKFKTDHLAFEGLAKRWLFFSTISFLWITSRRFHIVYIIKRVYPHQWNAHEVDPLIFVKPLCDSVSTSYMIEDKILLSLLNNNIRWRRWCFRFLFRCTWCHSPFRRYFTPQQNGTLTLFRVVLIRMCVL